MEPAENSKKFVQMPIKIISLYLVYDIFLHVYCKKNVRTTPYM